MEIVSLESAARAEVMLDLVLVRREEGSPS
jgi:hypothetical protein